MKGANALNVERGNLLQHRLNILAKLAHNSKIIATRLASPAFGVFDVVRAEFAECIRREQYFVLRIVREHNLGPVHISCADEA